MIAEAELFLLADEAAVAVFSAIREDQRGVMRCSYGDAPAWNDRFLALSGRQPHRAGIV